MTGSMEEGVRVLEVADPNLQVGHHVTVMCRSCDDHVISTH